MKILLFLLIFLSFPNFAQSKFIGQLKLKPANCQESGICTLAENFSFIDSKGVGWQASAGNKTDGASIPPWAMPFVGAAFTQEFVKAAVIHDHYCDRKVRPWEDTHKVFYEALLVSNVPSAKAKLLYYAVLVGGPKWVTLVPAKICSGLHLCTRATQLTTKLPEAQLLNVENNKVLYRPSQLEKKATLADIEDVKKIIEELGEKITIEDIEALAKSRHGNDFFLKSKGEIQYFHDDSMP